MNRWEATVALAREVAEECEKGRVDPAHVQRLSRAVLDLQAAMVGTARRKAGRPAMKDPPSSG